MAETVETMTARALEQLRAGAGLRGVVTAAAATLDAPVVLVSRRRRVVAEAGLGGGDPLDLVREASLTVPVEVRGMNWGGLSLAGDPGAEAEPALLRAAELIELELLHSTEPAETDLRVQREFFADLLSGRTAGPYATARAGLLGRALSERRPLVALSADKAQISAEDVSTALETAGARGAWAPLDNELLILAAAIGGEDVETTGKTLAEALARGGPRGNIVGLASPAASLEESGRRLREARDAVAVARMLRADPGVILARELLVDRVLARILTERDFVDAFQERLTPLTELPAQTCATLLRTLEVFLDAGGSKTLAARELGLRRQSLYRRLRRIEDLLGSLDQPERRLALHLAVRAKRLWEPQLNRGTF